MNFRFRKARFRYRGMTPIYLTYCLICCLVLGIKGEGDSSSSWRSGPPEGLPELSRLSVECGKEEMTVRLEFSAPFDGTVYSKGAEQRCVHVAPRSAVTETTFTVGYGVCGTRSDPRGRFYENTVVVQFDEAVLEAWDEARRIRCEWHDGYEKSAFKMPIAIADLDVVEMNFQGDDVDCWLEVQDGRGPWSAKVEGLVPLGSPLTLVVAIQDGEGRFDMRVKSCLAHSGHHHPVHLTDGEGCVLRPTMMTPFRKTSDTKGTASVIAYSHFYAFKFPETVEVTVQCTVEICRHGCPPTCQQEEEGGEHHPNADVPTYKDSFAFSSVVTTSPVDTLLNLSSSLLNGSLSSNASREEPLETSPDTHHPYVYPFGLYDERVDYDGDDVYYTQNVFGKNFPVDAKAIIANATEETFGETHSPSEGVGKEGGRVTPGTFDGDESVRRVGFEERNGEIPTAEELVSDGEKKQETDDEQETIDGRNGIPNEPESDNRKNVPNEAEEESEDDVTHESDLSSDIPNEPELYTDYVPLNPALESRDRIPNEQELSKDYVSQEQELSRVNVPHKTELSKDNVPDEPGSESRTHGLHEPDSDPRTGVRDSEEPEMMATTDKSTSKDTRKSGEVFTDSKESGRNEREYAIVIKGKISSDEERRELKARARKPMDHYEARQNHHYHYRSPEPPLTLYNGIPLYYYNSHPSINVEFMDRHGGLPHLSRYPYQKEAAKSKLRSPGRRRGRRQIGEKEQLGLTQTFRVIAVTDMDFQQEERGGFGEKEGPQKGEDVCLAPSSLAAGLGLLVLANVCVICVVVFLGHHYHVRRKTEVKTVELLSTELS